MRTAPGFVLGFVLLVASGTAGAQSLRLPPVEELMGADTFTATGLCKLSDEELATLNRWVLIYQADGGYHLQIEGMRDTVRVRQIR